MTAIKIWNDNSQRMVTVRRMACVIVLMSFTLGILAEPVMAQLQPTETGYRFKPGDRIQITVPERPTLNRELLIDARGFVNIPVVGEVEVAGLTREEIHEKLFQVLHEVYPSLGKMDFSIESVPGILIYVTGEVSSPGGYTFSNEPTLWQAIREAGGPTGEAALDAVRIVEDQSTGGGSRTVDVLSALEDGSTEDLPLLKEGDTVVILSKRETYIGSLGVNVLGSVGSPGFYRLQSDHQDVMSAIIMAGGPTGLAKLSDVRVVRLLEDGTPHTQRLNLERFLNDGDLTQNPDLLPGDTVSVPEKSAWFRRNIPIILSIVATTATVILVVDRVNKD